MQKIYLVIPIIVLSIAAVSFSFQSLSAQSDPSPNRHVDKWLIHAKPLYDEINNIRYATGDFAGQPVYHSEQKVQIQIAYWDDLSEEDQKDIQRIGHIYDFELADNPLP